MWRCLWVHKNFLVILPDNDGGNGGGGGVEVPVREDIRVEECMREKKRKKRNKKKGWPANWCSGSVRWVVGSGVRWGTWEPKKIWSYTFFFFFGLTGTLHSSPLIKISSSKFYVPWSWKRLGYLDNISSSRSQDASFAKWFFQSTFTQDIVLLRNTCSLHSKISTETSSYDKSSLI